MRSPRRPLGTSTARTIASLLALSALGAAVGCGSTIDAEIGGRSGASSSGGVGGAGVGGAGAGGEAGGGQACVPGTLVECYDGPPGTEGVGVCHGGAKKCDETGAGFGACQWEVTPKAEVCATPDDEDCDGATPSCPGETAWSEALGGDGNEYAQGVAIDSAGNLIVIGGFTTTMKIGGATLTSVGQNDFFVAKFDATGAPLWAKSYGSDGVDFALDVAVDPNDNIVLTGIVAGNVDLGDGPLAGFGGDDIFVLKLDPQGGFLWRKMFGSALDDYGYGAAADDAGNVIVTGSFDGTVDLGAGSMTSAGGDIYVAKYTPDGAPLWVKQFAGTYMDYGSDVVALPGGGALVTGGFYGPVDFGTGPLFTSGGYDAFVLKLDATGKTAWVTQLASEGGMGNFPVTNSVAADPSGAAVVSGYFKGSVDFGGGALTSAGGTDAFVAKYDGASGAHVFSQRFGGSYVTPGKPNDVTDGAFSVATDAGGGILLTGMYIDTIDLGGGPLGQQPYGDMFFARFDANGKHVVSKNYGTAVSFAQGTGVAATKSGGAVLAGYFVGTIDFGKGPLTTATTQDTDMYLAGLAP